MCYTGLCNNTTLQIRKKKAVSFWRLLTYLYILALEVVLYMIKTNENIEGLDNFDYLFLYSAYSDDPIFFLKCKKSVMKLLVNISWLYFKLLWIEFKYFQICNFWCCRTKRGSIGSLCLFTWHHVSRKY